MYAIDLFSGSGAVTWGIKKAGFKVVSAVDFDAMACQTYRLNHPEVNLIERDIRLVFPAKEFSELKHNVDLLAVCAPCQPFSNRNRHKIKSDEREELVLQSLKFIRYFDPSIAIFENVPGLERNEIFQGLTSQLKALGYSVGAVEKLDAAQLGVPQRRVRMLLTAAKSPHLLKMAMKRPSHQMSSVRSAISDLPTAPMKSEELKDTLHFRRAHSALNLERLSHIPADGGSRHSLPERLVLNCHKGLAAHKFPDCYGRMSWDDVAPTLTTGCTDFTKGRYVHPVENRAITLREAARLQTFPDNYHFAGNASDIAAQIGNAVPPIMMKMVAKQIGRALESAA